MGEFNYSQSDDFSQAAARILKLAASGVQDAQQRLASEGFFKRAALSRTFQPSLALLRDLLAPMKTLGIDLVKSPETAKAYCDAVPELISAHLQTALDSNAQQRKLMLANIGLMAQSTAEVLTKASHDRTWIGNAGLADEFRRALP